MTKLIVAFRSFVNAPKTRIDITNNLMTLIYNLLHEPGFSIVTPLTALKAVSIRDLANFNFSMFSRFSLN